MRTSLGRWVCAALAIAPALWLCVAFSRAEEPGGRVGEAIVAKAADPHWAADRCDQCHRQGDGEKQMTFSPFEIESLCTSCHDGVKASRSVHPSLRPAAGTHGRIEKPADWPLVDNKIGCVTCHDIKMHCRQDVRRPAVNAVFLRASEGRNLARFCNKCHVREAQQRFNPHIMLDKATGKPDQKACLYCHSQVTPVASVTESGWIEAPLRKDVSMLCTGCHTRHVDYFEPGHMNAVASEQILNHLRRNANKADESQTASSKQQKQATKADASSGLLMPLGSGDRVVCFTCHNPHQKGLFPADSHVARGAMDVAKPGITYGLRFPQRELCRVCHSH